jgi:hypothetical protein
MRKIMGKRKGYSEKASASSSNAGTKLMSFEIAIYPVDVRKKNAIFIQQATVNMLRR